MSTIRWERFPLAQHELRAQSWLAMGANLGLARNTVEAYARGLEDFLARSDVTQVAGVGSPSYMSPEQIKGEEVDWRTDVYSLGLVAYEVLAGKRPLTVAAIRALSAALHIPAELLVREPEAAPYRVKPKRRARQPAIADRDPEGAERAMRLHLAAVQRAIMERLAPGLDAA